MAKNYPKLPMSPDHQRMIEAGRKTTTLRGKIMLNGIYSMFRFEDGEPKITLVKVGITNVNMSKPVNWIKMMDRGRLRIADSEGYDTTEAFEKAVRRIRGGSRFLAGKREMYLHHLEVIE